MPSYRHANHHADAKRYPNAHVDDDTDLLGHADFLGHADASCLRVQRAGPGRRSYLHAHTDAYSAPAGTGRLRRCT
jgi:TnpA family transposase